MDEQEQGPTQPLLEQDPEHDLLAVTRFKNLILYARIRAYGTGSMVANAAGASHCDLYGLLNLRCSPLREDGSYTTTARKLAQFFEMSPDDLFPASLYGLNLPAQVERTANSAQLMPLLEARSLKLLPTVGDLEAEEQKRIMHLKLQGALAGVLHTLTAREEKVIQLRYGIPPAEYEHTLEETAETFGIHKDRVRQIEMKAMRKLLRAHRKDKLRPFIQGGGG